MGGEAGLGKTGNLVRAGGGERLVLARLWEGGSLSREKSPRLGEKTNKERGGEKNAADPESEHRGTERDNHDKKNLRKLSPKKENYFSYQALPSENHAARMK